MVQIGNPVTFVDSRGVEHAALATAVWNLNSENLEWYKVNDPDYYPIALKNQDTPSINLIIVSDDETKKDSYGRQIERHTSVVHEVNQLAHGNYWK